MDVKFIKKYMRAAKQFGEDQNPCLSRSIGCYIVDPVENRILGTGYNGPPQGVPHCDSRDHLENVVWPLLTKEDIKLTLPTVTESHQEEFLNKYSNCQTCPRRLVNAPSGSRYELCSCVHSEVNAIINASQSLRGSWCFIWGGYPCWECAKVIVRSRIAKVICTSSGFSMTYRVAWLFGKSNVEVTAYDEGYLLS